MVCFAIEFGSDNFLRMNRDWGDKCNVISNGTIITKFSGIILNLTHFMGHKLSGSVYDVIS